MTEQNKCSGQSDTVDTRKVDRKVFIIKAQYGTRFRPTIGRGGNDSETWQEIRNAIPRVLLPLPSADLATNEEKRNLCLNKDSHSKIKSLPEHLNKKVLENSIFPTRGSVEQLNNTSMKGKVSLLKSVTTLKNTGLVVLKPIVIAKAVKLERLNVDEKKLTVNQPKIPTPLSISGMRHDLRIVTPMTLIKVSESDRVSREIVINNPSLSSYTNIREKLPEQSSSAIMNQMLAEKRHNIRKRKYERVILNKPPLPQYFPMLVHCPFNFALNNCVGFCNDQDILDLRISSPGSVADCTIKPWLGLCPVCSLNCTSVGGNYAELFEHLDNHKSWLLFSDVGCHICPPEPRHYSAKPCFQTLEEWRAMRVAMLGRHYNSAHNVKPLDKSSHHDLNPCDYIYDLLIDPTKVLSNSKHSPVYSCPSSFEKHMMEHSHILSCRIICYRCFKKYDTVKHMEADSGNDLFALRLHYKQFHSDDLGDAAAIFHVRVKPVVERQPASAEIVNETKLLPPPKMLYSTNEQDVFPKVKCPKSSTEHSKTTSVLDFGSHSTREQPLDMGEKAQTSSLSQTELFTGAHNLPSTRSRSKVTERLESLRLRNQYRPSSDGEILSEDLCKDSDSTISDVVDIQKIFPNMNHTAYASIETFSVETGNGMKRIAKIIKKDLAGLHYQCPHCIYSSKDSVSAVIHVVRQHVPDQNNEADDFELETRTLLMHCRLCAFVTYHQPSLLWHFQGHHNIMDKPLRILDARTPPVGGGFQPAWRTPLYRCRRWKECGFVSPKLDLLVRHLYQVSVKENDNFVGLGHIQCTKSNGVFELVGGRVVVYSTEIFVCVHCYETFESRGTFASHYLRDHSKRLLYNCLYCEHLSCSVTDIVKHIDCRHSGITQPACSVMIIGDLLKTASQKQKLSNVDQSCRTSTHQPTLFQPIGSIAFNTTCTTKHSKLLDKAATYVPGISKPPERLPKIDGQPTSESLTKIRKLLQKQSLLSCCPVMKAPHSDKCVVEYEDCKISLPYHLIKPLLQS